MATEFTVKMVDQPGTLANLTEALARNAVNILAIHATPCPAQGVAQFITDNTDGTTRALSQIDAEYTARDVLLVTLAHRPGVLAVLARALGNAGVNINALYLTMSGQVVLDVSDLSRAQQVIMTLDLQ